MSFDKSQINYLFSVDGGEEKGGERGEEGGEKTSVANGKRLGINKMFVK